MQKFCVLTVGRAGSTALMDRLSREPDIALPGKNIDCVDQELVHPARVAAHADAFARLSGAPVSTVDGLIEAFFAVNAHAAFAGFKTMPNRHRDFERFVNRSDIRFITLSRRDIASTVASFVVAMATDSWRRDGGAQTARWRVDPKRDGTAVIGNLRYVLNSMRQLEKVPDAIALAYEDLCDPTFRSPPLDAFFERAVRIDHPKPPTSGHTYVANWDEFRAFIDEGRGAGMRKEKPTS
jgi:LPS sulfotransferase NodH